MKNMFGKLVAIIIVLVFIGLLKTVVGHINKQNISGTYLCDGGGHQEILCIDLFNSKMNQKITSGVLAGMDLNYEMKNIFSDFWTNSISFDRVVQGRIDSEPSEMGWEINKINGAMFLMHPKSLSVYRLTKIRDHNVERTRM